MSSVARARRTNRDTRTMEEKGDTETGDKVIQTCKENRGEQDRDREWYRQEEDKTETNVAEKGDRQSREDRSKPRTKGQE